MAPRQLNDVESAQADVLRNFSLDGEDDLGDNTIIPGNDDDDDADNSSADDNDELDAGDDDLSDPEKDNDDDADDDTPPVAAKPATAPVEDPNEKLFRFKQDKEGNFIDKDGKIIVRRGGQRDLFVRLKKAWQGEANKSRTLTEEFQKTVSAARQLLTRYNALKAEKSIPESLGLTSEETKQAAEMMAMMKIDPKAAIRNILTKMHLAGTDLKDIGVNGPLDAKAVAEHLLKMQDAAKPKPESEEDKALKVVNEFFGRHPTAKQYVGALAEAKRRFPHMTYDEIWYQLLVHSQKKPATDPVADAGRKPNRPIPHNGRRPVTAPVRGKISLKAVDPSQSFSQIGRDLLRDLKAAERE